MKASARVRYMIDDSGVADLCSAHPYPRNASLFSFRHKMPFTLYDYLNSKAENEFKTWTTQLQKVERGKLNARLDWLYIHGTELRPEILAGTGLGGIEKLKVKGQTQLRPLLCDGPISVGLEFTLLLGAREKGDKWSPKDAPHKALVNKQTVLKNHSRRKIHERVS